MKITMKASLKAVFTGAALGMIPVLQVTHAQQVVDPAAAAGKQSSIGQTLNGTAVQNIAAPNANGLSHNQFSTFNVGKPGLVINNSSVNAISQIGGAVVANPNLAAATARLILNEVTSANRSILQGAQELIGARAGYILANPNGITCDGCGFINFPRATLSTGAPQFDGSGVFTGFGVRGGDVLIGPGGLNATGADAFDIITRSAVINGQVNAKDLSLRLGSNDVDYETLAVTARADGDVPLFALDSSALGGMYAGRISLIGTDAGVGVRVLGTMAASVSDIELNVNGQISFKDNLVSAQRDITLTSTQLASTAGNEIELLNAQISAGRKATLTGGDMSLGNTTLNAVENLSVDAQSLQAVGGKLEAGQDLNLQAVAAVTLDGATVQAAQHLDLGASDLTLQGGSKLMGESDRSGTAGATRLNLGGALSVQDSALLGGGALNITAASVNVDAASDAAGTKGVRGVGAVVINTAALTNAGLIASDSSLTLGRSGAILSNQGKVFGQTGVDITAATLTNNKTIESGAAMTLAATTLNNTSTATSKAELYAVGALNVNANHTLKNTSTSAHTAAMISRDGVLSIDSRSGTGSTQLVSNEGGLMFGGAGVNALVSRYFENKVGGGKRGYVFANTGNILIGEVDEAAVRGKPQDIYVVNTDSDIESRAGGITINASYLRNTTSSTPLVNTSAWTTVTSGTYDHDNDPSTAEKTIEDDCGHYEDHFNKSQVGKICARWVSTRSQTMATSDLSPRSRIFAGNNFTAWIEKEALNYVSLISAGNNVTINGAVGASFENRAVELRSDKDALLFLYKEGDKVGCAAGQDWCYWDGDAVSYRRKEFEDISPSPMLYTYTVGMASTVQAGGGISVNIGRLANNSGERGEKPGVTVGTGTTQSSGGGSGAIPGKVGALTSSPFFLPSSNPSSPFLFETDPRLMSLDGLYGSDLFLQSLGLDPTKYLRAGDPYFEQQLLRQQLLAEAGQLFIADGLSGENDQFKLLMENATAAKDDLQLRVGVALTKEQINNLQKDIVWMVETEVNGKKVLVPQLYLSDATKAKLADGARFVASNINVKTEGSITNSGAFVASNSMALNAGTTFTNTQGTLLAANGLSIQATGDILNQSGTIRGGDVSLTSTEGSIRNETLKVDQQFGNFGTVTHLSETATIESTGNLSLNAKQDIVSLGGQISAEGNATLDAGRDISFQTIEKHSFDHTHEVNKVGGHTTVSTSTERTTQQVGSGLTVGGNMSATAGNNINIIGSSVDVAGNGSLDAGGDINIAAAAERRQSESKTSTKSWNSSYSQETTIDHTTGKASTLNFGGDMSIASGGNTNIVGSQVGVGGDLNVDRIGGNLNVTTFEEKLSVTQVTKTSSVFGGEVKADAGKNIGESQASASASLFSKTKETTEIDATTHLRSGISVGGNLNAGEGAIAGNVNITGSNIATGGDMNLAAGGDINILAANDSMKMETTRTSNSLSLSANASVGGGGVQLGYENSKSFDSVTQATAQVSGLSAGGNININAGGNFTEQGTQVAAGGNIDVQADSITSLAAQNTYSEYGNSRTVSVGLGVTAETGLDGVVNSFIKPGTNQAGFNMAEASKSINALSAPDPGQVQAKLTVTVTNTSYTGSGNEAIASGFSSGGSTSFTAREGNVTFHGTQVDAGGDINVRADKGAIEVLTADSETKRTDKSSETSVSLGVSGDGTATLEGSGSTSTQTSGTTTQQAAAFRSGGNLNLDAQKDVTLVGTEIEAAGTASIESRTGAINFREARDTTLETSSETSAHASVSVNVVEKSGSVGGGASQMDTRDESSTGKAGSIKANNIVLKAKTDITLVGTNIDAQESASLAAETGTVDFQAVTDTRTRTAKGWSADVSIEAGKTGGGVEASMSRTDEFEDRTTRTGGSLNAKNLSITAGNGIRLEGTQVDVAQNANIDAGKGALTIEAAVSTETRRINNISVGVAASADTKEKSGQGSFESQGEFARDDKVKNNNAMLKIGGNADIKAAGGIDIKGKDVTGVGSVLTAANTNLNGADVRIAKLTDVDESSSRTFGVSVGVIVPGKKTRDMVADKAVDVKNRVRDSDALNAVQNKLTNAGTALTSLGRDDDTKRTFKDAASQTKADRTTALADRQAARTNADIANKQKKQDQKADFDRQQSDDRATRERDQRIAAIDADTTRTDAQKAADRVQANQNLDNAKKDNANAANQAKQTNATEAATARDAALTSQAARKDQAADKAIDSRTARQDAAGNTETADTLRAQKTADSENRKADTDKTRADQAAKQQREDSDRTSRNTAEQAEMTARAEQAGKDKQADDDATLTPQQREDAKTQNAKDAQRSIDTAKQQQASDQRESAKREQMAQSDAQKKQDQDKVDAEKKRQEAVADAEFQRTQNTTGDGERTATERADNKLTADKAEAERKLADAQQQAETDRAAADTRATDVLAGSIRDADTQREATKRAADAAYDTAKTEADRQRTDKIRDIDADSSKTEDQKRQERETANQDHEQALNAATAQRDTAKTAADTTHADALRTAATTADGAIATNADTERTAKETATTTRDTELSQAEQERRDQDTVIDQAKQSDQSAREARRDKAKDKAAQDATLAKDGAQLRADERSAQATADATASQEVDRIQRDDTLSAQQKADQLKAAADKQAEDREAATQARADAIEARQKTRDTADKQAAIDALDPNLSDADKQTKLQSIDADFDARQTAREKQRDDARNEARDQREQSQAKAQFDLNKRQAHVQADAARSTADGTANTDHQSAVDAIDQQLQRDLVGKTPAEQATLQATADAAKRAKDLDRDTALADNKRVADEARATADAQRAKDEAAMPFQREREALNAITPAPADRAEKLQAINQRETDAKKPIDDKLAAQKRDLAATQAEAKAELDRDKRNADIDADSTLNAQQKAQKKKESETTFQQAQKAAQTEHDAAAATLASLKTPAEKAADAAAAAKAEQEGARVKNPYALSTRAKSTLKKAERWKNVLTSLGVHGTSQLPEDEPEEEEPPTVQQLGLLAQRFALVDRAQAMTVLSSPEVQQATKLAAALDAMREEARGELRQELQEQYTGKRLGVLTVTQQREALADLGIELPADLPQAEVRQRFNSYLDAAVSRVQPDVEQMAEMLDAIGIQLPTKPGLGLLAKPETDLSKVQQLYQQVFDQGQEKAREQAKGMTPAQTAALLNRLQP